MLDRRIVMALMAMPNETARLRKLVSYEFTIRYTNHARDEMRADDIIHADVQVVLSLGRVTWVERKQEPLWHVEGRDVDGRSIRLVVAAYEHVATIKVVTAMTL